MTSPSALVLRGLRKSYGPVVAVDGLDLDVNAGECFGLLGPNGAGKTTTIEICEGLLEKDSGDVEVLGMTWRDAGDSAVEQIRSALAADSSLRVQVLDDSAAARALRTGKIALVVVPASPSIRGGSVEYTYDLRRSESRTARLVADQALQRAAEELTPSVWRSEGLPSEGPATSTS